MPPAALAPLLRDLTDEAGGDEAVALAKVLEAGTRSLLRERVLARLIRGEISRDEAIAAVGIDWVLLTERQAETVAEDVAWASKA
jgi:hypothetical protein